jgi:hypothetical protein
MREASRGGPLVSCPGRSSITNLLLLPDVPAHCVEREARLVGCFCKRANHDIKTYYFKCWKGSWNFNETLLDIDSRRLLRPNAQRANWIKYLASRKRGLYTLDSPASSLSRMLLGLVDKPREPLQVNYIVRLRL